MEGGGGRFDGLVKFRRQVSNKKGHDLVSRIILLELGVARCMPLLLLLLLQQPRLLLPQLHEYLNNTVDCGLVLRK